MDSEDSDDFLARIPDTCILYSLSYLTPSEQQSLSVAGLASFRLLSRLLTSLALFESNYDKSWRKRRLQERLAAAFGGSEGEEEEIDVSTQPSSTKTEVLGLDLGQQQGALEVKVDRLVRFLTRRHRGHNVTVLRLVPARNPQPEIERTRGPNHDAVVTTTQLTVSHLWAIANVCPNISRYELSPGVAILFSPSASLSLSNDAFGETGKAPTEAKLKAKMCNACLIEVASYNCVDCEDLFCGSCAQLHRRMKLAINHSIIPFKMFLLSSSNSDSDSDDSTSSSDDDDDCLLDPDDPWFVPVLPGQRHKRWQIAREKHSLVTHLAPIIQEANALELQVQRLHESVHKKLSQNLGVKSLVDHHDLFLLQPKQDNTLCSSNSEKLDANQSTGVNVVGGNNMNHDILDPLVFTYNCECE